MIIFFPLRLVPVCVFSGCWLGLGTAIGLIGRQAFLAPSGLRLQDAWVIPVALLSAFILWGMYRDAFKNEEESGVAGFLESMLGMSMRVIFVKAVLSLSTGVAMGAALDVGARPSRFVSASQAQASGSAAEPVKRAPRLQGIFYNSTKPAAIVDGKTVLVGEEISGWRVTAIEPKRVFLQRANGETYTLALR